MIKKTIFILLCISTLLFANGKPTSVDKEIMELGLNYQFEEADMLLEKNFKDMRTLKYHYLYLNVELLKSIKAAENIPYKFKQAVKDSVNQILIDYTENFLSDYDEETLTIDEKFYLGSIYGLLGRFYGVQKSWMSAFSNGKEGKNILEEVIEKEPNYTDAYLLLGMLNYYVDRMGGVTEFIASILGLSGDRQIGLAYLHQVEKNGSLTNWQATMILSELYSRLESNKPAALPLLKKFSSKFPNNSHFTNWYCYELVETSNLVEASKIINSEKGDLIKDFVKGKYYHLIGDYAKSKAIYDTLLIGSRNIFPWVKENGKFNQAINYIMLGDKIKAEKSLMNLSESYDLLMQELLKDQNLTQKFISLKEKIISHTVDINKFIGNQPEFEGSQFFEAFFNFYVGVNLFNSGKYAEAEKYFLASKKLANRIFAFRSSNYLLQVYDKIKVPNNNVEMLIDEIDELNSESLDYRASDLEEKYNL